jgi:hypothetical protein
MPRAVEQFLALLMFVVACFAIADAFHYWALPILYEFRCERPLPPYRLWLWRDCEQVYRSGQCCEIWYAPRCETWRNAH